MAGELVLVTGGSGYLGGFCILEALREGYRVRTTVRSLKRSDEVREVLRAGGGDEKAIEGVEFCEANLSSDEGWHEACKGCAYVLHVASPFPSKVPKDADELIIPARDGTLRVLKAAKAAGTVKRVVVTSSTAAISYGHAHRDTPFTEQDWTRLDDPAHPVAPYPRSKTIAEKAAWDWISENGGGMELSTVCPVGIFGPVLSKNYATSIEICARMMNGDVPGLPRIMVTMVDVRDAAALHLKAMVHPEAAGERFLCIADDGCQWMKDVALNLKKSLGDRGKKIPTRGVPSFVLRIMGWFDGTIALVVPELDHEKAMSNEKAKRVLDWHPRGSQEAMMASCESLIKFGVVR